MKTKRCFKLFISLVTGTMLSLSLLTYPIKADEISVIPVDTSTWTTKNWIQFAVAQLTAQGIDIVGQTESFMQTIFNVLSLDSTSFQNSELYLNKDNKTISFDVQTAEYMNDIANYIYDTYYVNSNDYIYTVNNKTFKYIVSDYGQTYYLSDGYIGNNNFVLGTSKYIPLRYNADGSSLIYEIDSINGTKIYMHTKITMSTGTPQLSCAITNNPNGSQQGLAQVNNRDVYITYSQYNGYDKAYMYFSSSLISGSNTPNLTLNFGNVQSVPVDTYIEYLNKFADATPTLYQPSDVIDVSKRNAIQLPSDLVNTLDQTYGDAWTLADYINLIGESLSLDAIKEMVREQTMVIVDAVTGDIDIPIADDIDYVIPSDIAIPLINPELPDLPTGIALTNLIPTGNGLFNEIKYDMEQTFDMMISQNSQILIYAPFIILIVGLFLR